MTYVFDSNIWVAALRSRRGASFLILQALRQRLLTGAVSVALFLEYADVLQRDENLQINAQAAAIITFNVRDFLPAATGFNIDVVQPGRLVRALNLAERIIE